MTIVKAAAPYYGTKIGSFQTYVHDVVGDVFAVDERTIFIKDFSYDGQGPGKCEIICRLFCWVSSIKD